MAADGITSTARAGHRSSAERRTAIVENRFASSENRPIFASFGRRDHPRPRSDASVIIMRDASEAIGEDDYQSKALRHRFRQGWPTF